MQRKVDFVLVGLLSLLFLALYQESQKKQLNNSNLRVTQIAGEKLFELKKCADCHILGENAAEGKLTPVTNKRDDAWFKTHVETESPIVLRQAKSARKKKRVLKAEITALDDYLFQTKPKEKQQIDELPENIFDGAYLVYQNNCVNCHSIAGAGKEIAPDLTHVGTEHDKEWFIQNLINPQQFSPESLMPKFDKLPSEDLDSIANYLRTLL